MKINTLREIAAVAAFSSLSMIAMAGEWGRASLMSERPIEEYSQGRALIMGAQESASRPEQVGGPFSATLDNLADQKVQRAIGEYSLRVQVNPGLDALSAPAAGDRAPAAAKGAGATLIDLPYRTVDYGNLTASQKRQIFFGNDR